MGVYLKLVNHDQLFSESKSQQHIVNYYDLSNKTQMDELNNIIFTSYNQDSLEILPTCDCGALKGTYNVGLKCSDCNTECLPVTERPLESVLWITTPQGVDTLINPEVWIILQKKFMDGGVNVLEWLTNPRYRVSEEREPVSIKKLKQRNVGRGLNHFYQNFDSLMKLLIDDKIIKLGNQQDRDDLKLFLKENREAIFSKYIPIPSKMAFITESSAMGTYADPNMLPAIDAVRTISSIENGVKSLNDKTREVRTVQAIQKLAEYYETFYGKPIGHKSGWFRKHIYGSRTHFSFRAVIASLTDPHDYDEVHLPWGMAVMFLSIHLISKLLKRGFTPNEAKRHIHEHTLKYDILLDELFQELIAESPYKGLPIILQRNPSLTRGSAQQLFVTKIKTDPNINTVSVSVLILPAWNADFDGR
ncbi:MAG: hypothetical protein IBX57_00155 [Gammaproteobacteria bacterium]|nr:hypothetical protein [Gammaproteobacteria bacterium]